MRQAMIMAHRRHGPLGLENIEYEWQGGKVARLDWLHLPLNLDRPVVGQRFWLGPFHLRVIEEDIRCACVYVMRDGWQARAIERLYAISRRLELAYRRSIVTLAVWGLADYQRGWIPSWRDIHRPQLFAEPRRWHRWNQ